MTARELSEYVIGQAVEQLDELDGATTALRDGAVDSAGNHLRRAEDNILHLDLPVPVSLAATLLGVSERTVRDWIEAGILEVAGARPVALAFKSVAEVRRELQRLRREGASANVRRTLLHRIEDRATLEQPRLRESIEQMRSGKRHYVHRRPTS
ncbi:MAG: helix-turn-helix domain-containing protein [Chloroflexi bacterium]|nr:MAG: helix-turn-helix domain-containing protein [Chloroflexota bacterium]